MTSRLIAGIVMAACVAATPAFADAVVVKHDHAPRHVLIMKRHHDHHHAAKVIIKKGHDAD